MKHRNTINICAVLIGCFLVCAVMAEPITVAPQYEQRYSSILGELRCLVCQNQTIAESNADLAIDLRVEVKNMLEKGATDSEIIDFMANRYGDFILYRPQLKPRTYPLWFGPFLLLACGSFANKEGNIIINATIINSAHMTQKLIICIFFFCLI